MWRPLAAVLAVLLGLSVPPASAAPADRSRDLAEARRRADAAAARWAEAQSALARAQAEIGDLERRAQAAAADVQSLQGRVRNLAVRHYMTGRSPAVLVGGRDPSAYVRGQAMLRIVHQADNEDLERYQAARDDLADSRKVLERRLAERRAAAGRLQDEQRRATAELDRLAEAQRAYEARRAAEAAAAAAAAAARERQAAAARVSRATRPTPAAAATPPAAPAAPAREWVCPVQGPRSFTNDWGQPRSGGRRHQGTDILAPRNTPVVASVSGTVRGHNSSLGGISYYLSGDDGTTYFGTHLERLSGVSGRVAAGTVIGYVGDSGNARGGPTHLHFEMHPGGGRPVNPYPTLARYC